MRHGEGITALYAEVPLILVIWKPRLELAGWFAPGAIRNGIFSGYSAPDAALQIKTVSRTIPMIMTSTGFTCVKTVSAISK